jgi:hypothetical protein
MANSRSLTDITTTITAVFVDASADTDASKPPNAPMEELQPGMVMPFPGSSGHAMSPAWRWFIIVAAAALFIFIAARVLSVW